MSSKMSSMNKETLKKTVKRRLENKKKRDMLKANPEKAWPGLRR